jgi:hypothetical protein
MALGDLDVFHVGMVVADIDAAMRDLGTVLGVTWAPLQERDQVVRTGGGEVKTEHIRFTYSADEGMRLELIESREQAVWQPAAAGLIHHVGAYADDLVVESQRLIADGAVLEFAGGSREAPAGFAYHVVPGGLRVELVDGARKEQFQRWWSGGDLSAAR